MKKLSSMKSVLCVLGAGMLWGCMGILVRTLSAGGFSSLEVTAFRCVVTTIVMLGILVIRNPKDLKIRMRDLWCFVGTGICSVTFFNVCYFSCMQYTGLSVAAILLYTAPSFVMVMSFFLFKEKLGIRKLAALGLAFVGCVMVSGGLTGEGIGPAGLLTGLGAGFGYALYSIFGRYAIQRGYSSFAITFYTFLLAGIGTIPLLNLNHFGACLLTGEAQLPFAIFMSVLTTVVAYLLYTNGLKGLDNGKASIIASIEPVMASVVGLVVYGEAMTTVGVLGMVLVLFSCFLAGKEEK